MDAIKKIMSRSDKTSGDSAEDATEITSPPATTNGHADTLPREENDESPKAKIPKLNTRSAETFGTCDLSLRDAYHSKEFIETLRTQWNASATAGDYKHPTTEAQIYTEPYQICLLPELLKSQSSCKHLVQEMIEKVQWSRKQMDLYEFYQSTDLSNMAECRLLTSFLQMLRRNVRPWLEKVTGLKLDYVSASCSMYTCGDFLLVHDDLLKDRQVAFVYYLSPWAENEQWSADMGGCLEIFGSDEQCFPHFPVRRRIAPRNNQFVFFKVGSRSFHQVGEVTTFDYPRLTINGWFHGASNEDLINEAIRPFSGVTFKPPQDGEHQLPLLLNEIYLKPETRQSIQKRIEDNSEICLYEFLRQEVFERAREQLQSDGQLQWLCKGPANAHNYDVLDLASASGAIAELIEVFGCANMFALLRDYTDLDLSGPTAGTPTHSLELQRWTHGSYTVLGDGGLCEDNTLDLIFYLNASEGVGVFTYLSPEAEQPPTMPKPKKPFKARAHTTADSTSEEEDDDADGDDGEDDDSVLLTITPVDNSLNIVYRCEGTTKFTKYVSRNTPLEKGPVYVLSCSYKE